ncbi:ABC transporter permease [Robinsoniella peoriensis]|uniref:Glutathione transport system permease protein GsiC n=1 Tax=Robinsoniella peoriensis TaxID=180332 RepID=A0A4U8QAG4_9FIRM|nr:ABC transporter permease [Robinsoniella peoriensis]MDU7027750.1 ABC transporter permease [Clostridiales bacterium]TLD02020.1 Glutathione transport system permease protein GsiC [Robinsoniella peoriensis]
MKYRITHYIVLLSAVVILNFFLPRMLPGSPIAQLAGEEVGSMTQSERDRILSAYDLDKPLTVQFFTYIRNIVTLDWGISFSKKQPITDLLKAAIPWTLLLVGCNLILSTILGTFLGALSAALRKKKKDMKLMLLVILCSSLPAFWIGMIFISVFSVGLGWFPVYGAYSMFSGLEGWAYAKDVFGHLVLPVTTMTIVSISVFFTTSRYSVLETIHQDYVFMAKVRGIPKKRVRFCYMMRNALIPVFTVFMMELGSVLSGSVVIESVFAYPGLGNLLYNAVLSRDYPLMQYGFLVSSFMVIAASLLTDILYSRIDPRMVDEDEE